MPTHLGLYDDVKMLCGIIMWGTETFKKTDYVKTNDQQWNGVVPVHVTCTRLVPVFVRRRAHPGSELFRVVTDLGHTEAFKKRRCIATGNLFHLSEQQLVY